MQNNNWVFGTRAGLDFSTSPPTPMSGFAINTDEGCASVSDNNGNLLIYSDGITVWDSSHTPRATGLLGDPSSTQSCIFVPDPGNPARFYVLTMDGSTGGPPFNHLSGIRINTNTWVVEPLSTLISLPSNTGYSPAEKITAIQHRNCRDFWVIVPLQIGALNSHSGTLVFRTFLITPAGISHIADTPTTQTLHEPGYLKGSPDGTLIAVANGRGYNVLLFPFDNNTGIINVAGLISIPVPAVPQGQERAIYGLEFSPNSQLVYYANLAIGNQTGYIWQVNLQVNPLLSVQVGTVPNASGNYAIGALQLGPDGVIYFAKDDEPSLGAILSPNATGAACNVQNNYIALLPGTECELGLPNLIPNACEEDCGCGCHGCNEEADEQNEELLTRATGKFFTLTTNPTGVPDPLQGNCQVMAINQNVSLQPVFSFHWGDGANDQIEEHDTEVFYLTACNSFTDIQFEGLRITRIRLLPDIHPISEIHIVPDRFVVYDCLPPCSCQTREFAIITRSNDTAGNYQLEIEYCIEGISIANPPTQGLVSFPLTITQD